MFMNSLISVHLSLKPNTCMQSSSVGSVFVKGFIDLYIHFSVDLYIRYLCSIQSNDNNKISQFKYLPTA